MDFNEYQKLAKQTAVYPPEHGLTYALMGLGGEGGEILNKYKKVIRDQNCVMTSENKEDMKKELGDVLWYVAAIASEIGVELQDVAQDNINKLFSRKKRGKLKGSGDDR
jgi:NTP pyrophosphatase (non-canonical NTP hydrolase)